MPNIVIYRHQLFLPSEGFIFQQTQYLSKHLPIFAGRKIGGKPPIDRIITRTISSSDRLNLARHVLLRDPSILEKKITADNPALIHAHFGVEGVYALPLAKKLNIPLITTFHGFDATSSRQALLFSRKISWLNYLIFRRQLAREGNLFICVSDFIRNKLINLHFPEEKLLTHYIGIDTDLITPIPEKKFEKIILHVARLVEKKGTCYLLKAFSLLVKQGVEAKLVIIGDGTLKRDLETYSAELNISHLVQFLGVQSREDVISWMQKSSIFCLPSIEARSGDSEGLGMVFLEASACQLPIVATRHGGIPEAVQDNKTGLLVPEKDADALAEKLAYLLKNESVCEEMGKAGRTFVEKEFNLRKQTEKLEKIYQGVA